MISNVEFSVIVPAYNKEYSVIQAINSIMTQTKQASEVIIINDGSDDETLDVITSAFSSFENVVILDQDNKGVSAARNLGISVAKSEFVCFLDADDEWIPNFLERISDLIDRYPDAICFSTGHIRINNDNGDRKYVSAYDCRYEGYVDDFFMRSLSGSVLNSSKACVRKSSIQKLGGFPEGVSVGEDLFLWIKVALEGKIAYSTEALVNIYVQMDSSRTARSGVIPYPLHFVKEFCNQGEDQGLKVASYLKMMHVKHCVAMFREGFFSEAYEQVELCDRFYWTNKALLMFGWCCRSSWKSINNKCNK